MNSLGYTVYFISAELSTNGVRENESQSESLAQRLQKEGYTFKEAEGRYNGHSERSFVVLGAFRDLERIKDLGREYGQESVGVMHNDRTFELHFPDGSMKRLGTMRAVAPQYAQGLESYTKLDGVHYVVS